MKALGFLKIFLILTVFLNCFAYPFSLKSHFKKKPKPEKQKMVETVEEWKIEAQDIPLDKRVLEREEEPSSDKKNYFPKPNYTFEKYNYPAGTREYDLRFLKKNLEANPIIVSDLNIKYAAYVIYYYRADIDQVTSEFYIAKLDTQKSRTKRILEFDEELNPEPAIIKAGAHEQYPRLFRGLTVVDWSHDSNKVLVKELVGSTIGGNYRTYLYVHFLDKDLTIKLTGLNRAITNYYLNSKEINLKEYRYDIVPLGFSADNDDMIVFNCFALNSDNSKTFLGVWGFDLKENNYVLISQTNASVSISTNGLILKRVL